MALRYSRRSKRFYNDTTGRFITESQGRQSSIARKEFDDFQFQEIEPGVIIFPLDREGELNGHEKFVIKSEEGKVKDYLDDLFEEEEDFDLTQEDQASSP